MGKNTKQTGKTEVYPFWYMEDIKNMMDYFKMRKMWHWYLAFNFGLLCGRRAYDTLSFKWSHFFYENGRAKDEFDIKEQKTGKVVRVYVCRACREALELYIEKKGIDPFENYNDFIITTKRRTQLLKDENKYSKDEYKKLIYKATESQVGSYRKQFKIAANASGIKYPVSTHSTRKTFGYWSVKLHPYDVTTVDKLQGIFSHSERKTTLCYIGIAREDEIKLYDDMGKFIKSVANGEKPVIKNSPVIPLKAEDFRKILSECWDMAQNGEDKFEGINKMIGIAEKCMV